MNQRSDYEKERKTRVDQKGRVLTEVGRTRGGSIVWSDGSVEGWSDAFTVNINKQVFTYEYDPSSW